MKRAFMIFYVFAMVFIIAACEKPVPDGPTSLPLPTAPPSSNVNEPETVQNNEMNIKEKDEELAPESAGLASLSGYFAYTNVEGNQLLMLEFYDNAQGVENIDFAVGNNGQTMSISYSHFQERNEDDNGRQSASNFPNQGGHVFTCVEGALEPDTTYFICRAVDIEACLLPFTSQVISEWFEYPPADSAIIQQVEEIKSRSVIESNIFAVAEDGAAVGMFLFERMGNDMLFSLAYIHDNEILFVDFPAEYNEYSVWRADAGDHPGIFQMLFIAKDGEELMFGLSWFAPEGESASIYRVEGETLVDVGIEGYRYMAPN